MHTILTSFATVGLQSERIAVEVGISPGDGDMFIVGLGDKAVQESKHRVKLAVRASGYRIPTGRTMTINLAPADLKKVGPRYDLPIAVALLLVHGLIDVASDSLRNVAMLGELALDGSVRHVSGVLSAAIACKKMGIARLIVPAVNGPEAALVPGVEVVGVGHLTELVDILLGTKKADTVTPADPLAPKAPVIDFSDIRGQQQAKRALEIAAAGGHNVLLSGAPGSGKTLLARALQGILPPLSQQESLEVTQIYSVANLLSSDTPLVTERPFRAIHHTASGISIVGGGQIPGPGELSLAHKGVLFLDELAEFPASVLEVLRQPLEERRITINRVQGSVTFPSDVLLVAAMNPPQYSARSSLRMKRRISAPFLDRMDLTIDVLPVPIDDLQHTPTIQSETTATILERVVMARERQRARFTDSAITTNKEMGIRQVREFCMLKPEAETLLKQAAEKMSLSARSYHRTLKVARTIADLQGSDAIETPHLAEALQYRQQIGIEV